MGVYIKGMKVPKSCWGCDMPLGLLKCPVQTEEEAMCYCSCRHKDCPIVPVPPHGRLGDLDALTDKVIGKYIGHERKNELIFAAAEIKQDICDLIGDAPTIIPAEPAEEDET